MGVQLSSWINSLYQLVSQVSPLSFENACSHFATTGKPFGFSVCSHFAVACEDLGFTVQVKRTRIGVPLNVSGPSNIPKLPWNLPTTGG
jgi:hypothetical protein